MITTPTPEAIRAARLAAGLTQDQAAALVHRKGYRRWSEWEIGTVAMPLAEWELFTLKAPSAATGAITNKAGRIVTKIVDTAVNKK